MGTKNDPGTFDCYANAEPDEPMFVLLARDPLAPTLVRMWAELRKLTGRSGAREEAKRIEAYECAAAMETWQRSRHKVTPTHGNETK